MRVIALNPPRAGVCLVPLRVHSWRAFLGRRHRSSLFGMIGLRFFVFLTCPVGVYVALGVDEVFFSRVGREGAGAGAGGGRHRRSLRGTGTIDVSFLSKK